VEVDLAYDMVALQMGCFIMTVGGMHLSYSENN